MPALRCFLFIVLLFGCSVSAQSVAEVLKLPLLHDPNAPVVKQSFSAAEKQLVSGVARAVNARAEFRAFLTKNQAQFIHSGDVLLSFVAPFRSGAAERLTVFPVYSGDAAWLAFVFGEGSRVQVFITAEHSSPLCSFSPAYTVRDMNADGRREVAVVQGCGDGPGGGTSLNVYGAGKGGFQFWGSAELTYQFGGGDEWFLRSTRLFVQKGKNYQIYAVRRLEQGFMERTDGAEKLRLTEEGVAVLRVNLLVSPGDSDSSLRRLF